MAALADAAFIASSEVADAIPTEGIAPFIEGINLPPNIGLMIVSGLPGQGAVPQRVVRWNDVTLPDPVRAGGETDEFLDIDVTATSSDVAPVLKGVKTRIPDEPRAGVAIPGMLPTGALIELARHAARYRDRDILDTSLGATNIVGTDATVFDGAQFRTCMNTFITLENTLGIPVFVGGHSAFADLRNDFAEVMAQAAANVDQRIFDGTNNSYRGNIYGYDLWETGNIAAEGAGDSNFMTMVGGNVVIGGVILEGVRVESTRGDTSAARALTQYVLRWWDGYDLFRQDGIQECRSR
jgi:hypothetical protein